MTDVCASVTCALCVCVPVTETVKASRCQDRGGESSQNKGMGDAEVVRGSNNNKN